VRTYAGQATYFIHNRERGLGRYRREHDEYVALYERVLSRSSGKTRREAAALILLMRAAVYTNTAHELGLLGHHEEAAILLRNPVELAMLAMLVLDSDEVWALWQECYQLRVQHTREGHVDVPHFQDKKFNFNKIVWTHGGAGTKASSDPLFENLKTLRGTLSTRHSHENLYNIVVRVDHRETESDVYIGQDADSPNDRMRWSLEATTSLMKTLDTLTLRVPPEA
jgi:hypothetical protein